MDELVSEFLLESREKLQAINVDLVVLEHSPGDPEPLARIYRRIHSLGGTCGFLGFDRLDAVLQATETLLQSWRDGPVPLSQPHLDAVRQVVAALEQVLASLEATGTQGESRFESLLDLLERLGRQEPAPAALPPAPTTEATGDLLDDFMVEVEEHLGEAQHSLASLRRSPGDAHALSTLYRAFHSIRAACQFFAVPRIQGLTQAAEDRLLPHR